MFPVIGSRDYKMTNDVINFGNGKFPLLCFHEDIVYFIQSEQCIKNRSLLNNNNNNNAVNNADWGRIEENIQSTSS